MVADKTLGEMLNPKAIAVGVTAVFSDANYDISNTALMQVREAGMTDELIASYLLARYVRNGPH